MVKVCKIRCYPNKSQTKLINETLSCCRYIQNLYIEYNEKIYEKEKRFISGYEFSRIINKLKKNEPRYYWINNYSSKAIKDSIMNEEKAFKKFFKKKNGFPKFKSRKRLNKESFFFIKDNIKFTDNPNIIKIPILGKIRITEYKYLPTIDSITSGRVIREYDKYYIMFIYNIKPNHIHKNNIKLGIDVGIKDYATIIDSVNNCIHIKHFKDNKRYKELEKRIVILQEIISKKVEINYGIKINQYLDDHDGETPSDKYKNIMKGESYITSQIRRLRRKIRALKVKQRNIRLNFIRQLVNYITARTKPNTITIENLDISEMIKHNGTKDTTLHKYISESSFYYFKLLLESKCEYYGIKLRYTDKYFASSKICSHCGKKKDNISLNDRTFICDYCGFTIDRDENAAFNLLNIKDKKCKIKYA